MLDRYHANDVDDDVHRDEKGSLYVDNTALLFCEQQNLVLLC